MCACAVWLLSLDVHTSHPQSTELRAADAWTVAVDAYIEGHHVEAALSAMGLEHRRMSSHIGRAADAWQADGSVRAGRRLKAGAALLLEIAREQADAGDVRMASRYLDAGRDVVRKLEAGPRTRSPGIPINAADWRAREFAAAWRLNWLQYLLRTRQFSQVERTAQRSDVDALPEPLRYEWHLTLGAARETVARLWLEADAQGAMSIFVGRAGGSRATWIDRTLDEAAQHYRAALALAPTHPEVHLRLGRVLFEQGRADEARVHLERVAGAECQEVVCGLAAVFLGELHDARDDLVEAMGSYVRASSVPDVRQSALVGMLRVSLRQAPAETIGITRRFQTSTPGADPDAWGRYALGHLLCPPGATAALREEVRR